MKKAVADQYSDASLLHNGLDRMGSHLTTPDYIKGTAARQVLAAKCALLVAHLWVNEHFNFSAGRWAKSTEQLEQVKSASLSSTGLAWLDRLKATNPEAYFYLHRAVTLLHEAKIL